ncbi:MAG: 16S rRNA (guanine(527)-N(7))-methyltransferase RsmG [Firmicutes bacterium]|nr:16S rRNA (guanine(527)-N(7))-methyltransferase RsmG [Bacillota bacterium]
MKFLEESFEKLNIPFDNSVIEMFEQYMDGILEWNKKINLTAITDREEFISKHFVDSVLSYNFREYIDADSIIDIGTGAGFPGIPLAIVSPDKKFVLADSLNKRLKVINELASKIGIDNIETVHGRAEELARNKKYREAFALCISRAVANLAVLCEYCLPFIKVGGHLLAYKGPDAEEEVKMAEKAIKILGGKLIEIVSVDLDGYDHNIVVIEKINKTPSKYPRKAGTPGKEPIL